MSAPGAHDSTAKRLASHRRASLLAVIGLLAGIGLLALLRLTAFTPLHGSSVATSAHQAPALLPATLDPALDPSPFTIEDGRLVGTAAVTMATGDHSARQALALLQSLRDVGTRIPTLLVLLVRGGLGSDDCQNPAWKRAQRREHVDCRGSGTTAGEIVSQQYLDSFAALGAETLIIDPLPDTPHLKLPGGRAIFWGMALNKLSVFNLTAYRKVMWLDADSYVLKNIDHLMKRPSLSGAVTEACCNAVAPAYPGGGLWVLEPSTATFKGLLALTSRPVPGTDNAPWHFGDMQLIRHYFGLAPPADAREPPWPAIADGRHGYVEGLSSLYPEYGRLSPEALRAKLDAVLPLTKPRREGFIPELWDGVSPVWRALPKLYDQTVGTCECIPGRDAPRHHYTVHFSCMQGVAKPAAYETEYALMDDLYSYALSCTRHWVLAWYDTYTRAHGRLPAPYWDGPPVPRYNATHDALVRAKRLADPKG